MFFITLSCAEHYWPDIFRLIKERMDIANLDSSECYYGSKQTSQLLNDYSLVVQEYFQKRVETWLDIVGKELFGITHYWVRYEFAPGRGQIHAHLLAVSKHLEIYEKCHIDMKDKVNGEARRAERLSKWAAEKYGLTASVVDGFDDIVVDRENTPCKHRYGDVDEKDREWDTNLLLKAVQVHECNGFCLRSDSKGESRFVYIIFMSLFFVFWTLSKSVTCECYRNRRVCRCGAGKEQTAGQCDTPGFPMTSKAEVREDRKRSRKLFMPRNNIRLNQTSTTLLSSWRANCDVQILVYNCDPKNPDSSEISRVTDYVASYSCKGNYSLKEERQHNRDLIMASEDFTGDKADVVRICKQAMNKCASKRLISKQEAMVLLADLPLTLCTEGFECVSLTHSQQVSLKGEIRDDKKFISQYAGRASSLEEMCLHDYFHHIKNPSEKERHIIPNFIGITGTPQFPVTSDYARHSLIVYMPWREYPKEMDWIPEFERFIQTDKCPVSAKMAYERAMHRYYDKMQHYEPKASSPDHSGNTLSPESQELLELVGLHGNEATDYDDALLRSMDYGKDFEWDEPPVVSYRIKGI